MTEEMIMLDGPETSIPHFSPVCTFCRHWRLREGRTCDAFPEPNSIPLTIWRGENNHQAPFPGDHDIQFEPVDADQGARRAASEAPTA